MPGRYLTLAELMRNYSQDQFIFAVSPVYLRAIENDIMTGLSSLVNTDKQLRIVTSKAYRGGLQRWVSYSNEGMLEKLKTNFTALNISLACHLIDEIVMTESQL